jgi:hypothetical protein
MSQLGIGAMIGMLGGNRDTAQAMKDAIGRTIAKAELFPDGDGALVLTFTDGAKLKLYDNGRSCCESRYMTCDDDLSSFVGDVLTGAEVADAPTITSEWGDPHEQAFLKVRTDRGVITATTHNEHNGFYGGFWMCAEFTAATSLLDDPTTRGDV